MQGFEDVENEAQIFDKLAFRDMPNPDTDAISTIANYFENRCGALFSYVYPPYFICSWGCHLANLHNIGDNAFYQRGGRRVDLRLHTLLVSPPGYMKTYWMDMFSNEGYGILASTPVEILMRQSVTTAGLTGTYTVVNNKPNKCIGDAEEHKNAILCWDEMDWLLRERNDHSSETINVLLQIMDRGHVYKKIAHGVIKYKTNISFWGGTQPERESAGLKHGLMRRLFIMFFSPTHKDIQDFDRADRHAGEYLIPKKFIPGIRKIISEIANSVNIQGESNFVIDNNVEDFVSCINVPHYEKEMYRKLIIGYNIMCNYGGEDKLIVDLDKRIIRYVLKARLWRDLFQQRKGGRLSILRILEDNPRKVWSATEIKLYCSKRLSIPYDELDKYLEELIIEGFLYKKKVKKVGNKKHTTIYSVVGELDENEIQQLSNEKNENGVGGGKNG